MRRVLHARVYSDYYRFPINLHWHLQFIYWKMKFWCCPGVGHWHPILKPERGAFAAFPKQNDKCPTNAGGRMGTLGID